MRSHIRQATQFFDAPHQIRQASVPVSDCIHGKPYSLSADVPTRDHSRLFEVHAEVPGRPFAPIEILARSEIVASRDTSKMREKMSL